MAMLYLTPHPLGIVVRSVLDARDEVILGGISELLCEGDTFGGLSFEQLKKLAGISGTKIDADELVVD